MLEDCYVLPNNEMHLLSIREMVVENWLFEPFGLIVQDL